MTTPTIHPPSSRRAQPLRQTRTTRPRAPPATHTSQPHAPRKFYPALTAFTDALDSVPSETIRHFTLLREVDAKAVAPESHLRAAISSNDLPLARSLLSELLVTQDEKIHVVTTANEVLSKLLSRLEHAFAYVEVEVPEVYRLGSREHWAYRSGAEPVREPERKKRKVVAATVEKEVTPVPEVAVAVKEKRREPAKKRRPASAVASPLLPSPVLVVPVVAAPPPLPPPPPPPPPIPVPVPPVMVMEKEVVESPRKEMAGPVQSGPKKKKASGGEEEQTYCYCDGISYGEMVACDSDDCAREWFHLECVGLDVAPRGKVKWFCEECKEKRRKAGGNR